MEHKKIRYTLVDEQGNNVEGQYISHFDQMTTGFNGMVEVLTEHYSEGTGREMPEIACLAANYNSLRQTGFDATEVYSMLAIAMDQLARIKAAETLSARHGNPIKTGRN